MIYFYNGRMRGGSRDIFESYNMKLNIKENMHNITYLETNNMKPPKKPVKTKGAPLKIKSSPYDNSTK